MNTAPAPIDYTKKEQIMRQLARDIVQNIQEVPDILKRYNLTSEEYEAIEKTRVFKQMLTGSAGEWEGAGNTPERIKLKSAFLIENVLPDMFASLVDKTEPLSSRVALLNTIGKFGGVGLGPAPGVGSGQTFSLQINFRSDPSKNITITQPILPSEVIPSASEFGSSEDDL